MGFDVHGNKKDSYFRNNVWHWKPLWTYVAETCNLSDKELEAGLYNDGYAISDIEANTISKTLFQELRANRTQSYNLAYKRRIENLPYVTCKFCSGTGTRNDDNVQGDCNVCNSERTRKAGIPIGKEKNWETNYSFDVDNVKEFAQFCAESNGFKIC